MGELISLAERRAARADAHAPPARPRVTLLLRPRVAVDVPGGRARRAAASPACAGSPPSATALAGRPRRAAALRSAPPSERADALRLPLVWPERAPDGRAQRDARRRAWPPSAAAPRRSCSPPAGWRSAAATTSTTPRSSPRRPRPPASPSTTRSRPPASVRRDGADGAAPRCGCWRRAPTRCRRCVVGRTLFGGEHRLRRGGRGGRGRRSRAAGAPHARRLSRAPGAPTRLATIQGDAPRSRCSASTTGSARATRA